jgi:hypothetical protein
LNLLRTFGLVTMIGDSFALDLLESDLWAMMGFDHALGTAGRSAAFNARAALARRKSIQAARTVTPPAIAAMAAGGGPERRSLNGSAKRALGLK